MRLLSISSFGGSGPTQGLSSEVHSYHNQRSRSALENFSKFRIPSPPNCLGRQTFSQMTLHFPPLTISLLFQSSPRHSFIKGLERALISLDGRQQENRERRHDIFDQRSASRPIDELSFPRLQAGGDLVDVRLQINTTMSTQGERQSQVLDGKLID